jgi:hypothetical protein
MSRRSGRGSISGDLQQVREHGAHPVCSPSTARNLLTIEITLRAAFTEDPGSSLDATLDDGLDGGGLPGVKRVG